MTRETQGKQLRRARNGWICGVCKGLAHYTDIPVLLPRIGVVAAFFMSGFFPVIVLYVAAALLIKPAALPPEDPRNQLDSYRRYAASRHESLDRLKLRFDRLEQRAREMESVVTAREYAWEQKLRRG